MSVTTAPLETPPTPTPAPQRQRRSSGFFYRHPRLRLTALLAAPMLWLVVLYLGSLGIMLASAFWSVNSFTGELIKVPTFANFHTLLTEAVYRNVALRTLGIAIAVTLIDLVIALPIAFYAAKVVRSRRARFALIIAVTMPLWAGYLVKGFALQTIFINSGVLDWLLQPLGKQGPGFGIPATIISLAYLWLPYMILPIYAGFERIQDSVLEASADLGAHAGRTFRSVVLPLVWPSIVAGTIFTFSLSLGDYIMVKIVGGPSQMFANIIYDNVGVANNLPFAAAAAFFPISVIVIYLLLVRRTGALNDL